MARCPASRRRWRGWWRRRRRGRRTWLSGRTAWRITCCISCRPTCRWVEGADKPSHPSPPSLAAPCLTAPPSSPWPHSPIWQVGSVGEIAPRIDELTRAARLSLSLLKQLRAALDLDSSAPIATCIASAARKTKELAALEATTNHLCGLLQLHTHEALVPAVRQLSLSSRVGRE